MEYYQNHHHHHPHYDQEAAGHHRPLNRSESIVEKVKRLLRVDSDEDTGHLHNKVLLISPESVEIKSQPKII